MIQDGTKYILFDKDNKIVGITDEWTAKSQTEYTWIEYPYLIKQL